MRSALRIGILLTLGLLMLSACATSSSIASAPTATPTLTAQQQAVEAAPTDRVELASGRYQLLMFYSPL